MKREKGRSVNFKTHIGGCASAIWMICMLYALFNYTSKMINKEKNIINYDNTVPDWLNLALEQNVSLYKSEAPMNLEQ